MDNRRLLLLLIFSFSLVMLWDAWQKYNQPPPVAPVATTAVNGTGTAAPQPSTSLHAPAPVVPGAPADILAPAALKGETVTIRTDLFVAEISVQGGDIVRLVLDDYKDTEAKSKDFAFFDARHKYVAQSGLIGDGLPNHKTMFTVLPGNREFGADDKTLQLRLEAPSSNGVKVTKIYTFTRGSYLIDVTQEIDNGGDKEVAAHAYYQLQRDTRKPEGESRMVSTFTGPAVYTEAAKFQKIDFKDIAEGDAKYERSAQDGWIAMVQHYFTSAWLLPAAQPREFRTAKVGDGLYTVAMVTPLGVLEPGATRTHTATLYAGPQNEYVLAELAPGLDLVKDYGWFTILSKPLFWLLTQLHAMIGNWGWAIVALVVLLKIAFYWLNASAYRSMAKMKAVGPRLTELRERYKDKPQQMQQEMMRIYREEKVNPLGGCLPILVQMPFFIALYWVLLSSVEMRNAPWILWITDLSAKDPWFILPILMTASSLFQVWLNPRPPDPMQARLMWFMPLAFGVMFFFFPAGLVLYWLTNNILSIAQQWWINKRLGVIGK